MSRDPDSWYEEEMEQAMFVENTLKDISQEGIRHYLRRFGDAADGRVKSSIEQATKLKDAQYYQSAVVSGVTAIELTIRFLLLRPLIQGAFLSDEWAYALTQRVASGRTNEDRELLPKILEVQAIDLKKIKLPSGKELWDTIINRVYLKRDRVVHTGEAATKEDAELAITCATQFRKDIVLPIAKKLGFDPEKKDGAWNKGWTGNTTIVYEAEDPFVMKKRK